MVVKSVSITNAIINGITRNYQNIIKTKTYFWTTKIHVTVMISYCESDFEATPTFLLRRLLFQSELILFRNNWPTKVIWITQIMCLLEGMESVSWMYLQKVYIIKSRKQNEKWFNFTHLYSFNFFQYNSNFIYVYIKHLRLKNLEHNVHTYNILW